MPAPRAAYTQLLSTASLLIRDAYVLDPDLPFSRSDVLIENGKIAYPGTLSEVSADRVLADFRRGGPKTCGR